MFIWSIRASTLKFFAAVGASALILCLLVILVPVSSGAVEGGITPTASEVNYVAKTAAERQAFLAGFGWQVDTASESAKTVTLPREFDRVFAGYNEIQRAQGMDLAPYKGRSVESYTYTVTNYEDNTQNVKATLLVYQNVIIGGDICADGTGGFVKGFAK